MMTMSIKDLCLALCIIFAWGLNFVVIKLGVAEIPPLLLAGLRFSVVAFPALFFIRAPRIPLKWLIAYGMSISFGQFALLFLSIHLGMPAGLTSLLLQAQAFFTLWLGHSLLKEKIQRHHYAGMAIAVLGILLLAVESHTGSKTDLPMIPLLLVFAAALSWACGNICNKVIVQQHQVNPMSLVVWSALVPILPFFLCSWIFEGSDKIVWSLQHAHVHQIFVVGYLAFIATIMGYGLWGYLLSKYPTSIIAPLTLLVPVVGLITAAIFLGEHLSINQMLATAVIISGLVINVFGQRWIKPKLH